MNLVISLMMSMASVIFLAKAFLNGFSWVGAAWFLVWALVFRAAGYFADLYRRGE